MKLTWPGQSAKAEAVQADGSGRASQNAKNKKRSLSPRREMMALRPLRNPALEWVEEEGRIVLNIKRGQGTRGKWTLRLVSLFIPLPDNHRVVLDPIGTHVWQMLDGQTTVERIAKSLAKEYKITPREAELSLQQFFKELGRRGYIGFSQEQHRSRE